MQSENYYNDNALDFYEGTVNVDMSESYKPFLELIKEGGHILDAGCGSGRDNLYFIKNGYKVSSMDASDAMVDMASKLIGQQVLKLLFQDIDFKEAFDGIWACASLLHVNRQEIDDVLVLMSNALKSGGILYASFKYGDMEVEKDGRYFNYYDEISLGAVITKHPELETIKIWKTEDIRIDRKGESWISILIKKK